MAQAENAGVHHTWEHSVQDPFAFQLAGVTLPESLLLQLSGEVALASVFSVKASGLLVGKLIGIFVIDRERSH